MNTITVEGLGKRLGGEWVIEDISFEVARGEVFGLLGPNGAGKTTTLRVLAGLYAPDAGRATVVGFELTGRATSPAGLRRRVGLLTEQPGFYDRLPTAYNLVHFGRLYGLARREAEQRTAELLARFDLTAAAEQPFATLSRGMKQKLAIARAILHRPELVLLDEPTVGLDPEATREVRAIIAELAAEGRTIVLCTHQLSEVERLCSRAAVLARRLVGVHEVGTASAHNRVVVGLAAPAPALTEIVAAQPWVRSVAARDSLLEIEVTTPAQIPDLVAALVAEGARLTSVTPARDALEKTYLTLLAQARDAGLVS